MKTPDRPRSGELVLLDDHRCDFMVLMPNSTTPSRVVLETQTDAVTAVTVCFTLRPDQSSNPTIH